MKKWKTKFIEFIIKKKILIFGKFILKSGRISPYFFNISLFSKGKDLDKLGKFYAHKLISMNKKFDLLFGIAYKGIPILISTVIALKNYFNINVSYSFNRKEIKQYGEKGQIIGENIQGKIIILDDVLTSGKSIKNIIKMINNNKKSKISNILVALNRNEFGKKNISAKKEIKEKYLCSISSIININDIIKYLKNKNIMKKNLKILLKYRKKYILK
ncbi:orotate phosphoribosyltransferase [Buchnera aphidicola]|uniref:orotate phosphoribosyltransferase n=1 Tax=Buchnera aphidicola TaxID=9 RepID=UPI0031B8A2D0